MKSVSKIVLGGLVLSMGLIACGSNETPKKEVVETKQVTMKEGEIQNNHEWDELQEVVIGRWVPGVFAVPEVDPALAEVFPYIAQTAWDYMKPAENKLLNATYPDDDMEYYNEQENLVKLVKSLGIKVHRPEELEYEAIGTSQCYSRDPIVVIGNKFIVTNMNLENRRKETSNYRRIAVMLAEKYDGEVVSMPPLKAGYPEENAYLEGGDVFVDGKNVYVGMTGNASNQNGIDWLQKELGSAYTVHTIPLQHHVLHLDCAMMLINEKQGIICKEDFIDFDNVPEGLKNREWVEAKPEEAQLMATNGMVVNPKTIIMSDAFPHIAQQVRDMGIEVHEIPFRKANYFGGGIRCSYQPIYRK